MNTNKKFWQKRQVELICDIMLLSIAMCKRLQKLYK